MAQLFRRYDPKQALLLPPSLDDWLPAGHLSRFIADTVDELDIGPFFKKYREREDGRGPVAYHPKLMLKVLIYAYSVGIFSSRKIAQGVDDLVALRFLAAGDRPSHRTYARFRQENLERFKALFAQVVRIAAESGLVKMGTLAVDGTKLKANASRHKAMSYGRMSEEEKRLKEEIQRITRMAQEQDQEEDETFGPDFRGDELPEELQRRESRLKVIREAKERLEKEQAEQDEAQERGEYHEETGRGKVKRPNGVPPDKKQANFTDPDSRIMGNPKVGFVQGYNGQIAVDAEAQIIVANRVTQCAADNGELVAMTEKAIEIVGRAPEKLLADAGYRSEQGFAALEELGVDAHIPLGRGENGPSRQRHTGPATERMHKKRQTKRSRTLYKKRKAIIEPVFGWIKAVLGFRSFTLRGLKQVEGEWDLVCLALNLKRMAARLEWS